MCFGHLVVRAISAMSGRRMSHLPMSLQSVRCGCHSGCSRRHPLQRRLLASVTKLQHLPASSLMFLRGKHSADGQWWTMDSISPCITLCASVFASVVQKEDADDEVEITGVQKLTSNPVLLSSCMPFVPD